jgi:hypothetical protein
VVVALSQCSRWALSTAKAHQVAPGSGSEVRRGIIGLDGTGQIKRPKNGEERVVILPPPARVALAHVPVWMDAPWLFATPRGRRFSKWTHLHYWRPVRAAFGRRR